jgi:hypothetical protein
MQAIIDVMSATIKLKSVRHWRISTRSNKHCECGLRTNTGGASSR